MPRINPEPTPVKDQILRKFTLTQKGGVPAIQEWAYTNSLSMFELPFGRAVVVNWLDGKESRVIAKADRNKPVESFPLFHCKDLPDGPLRLGRLLQMGGWYWTKGRTFRAGEVHDVNA